MGVRPFVAERDDAFDVVIVGSGPAGLGIALELDRTPLRIAVIESGGPERDDRIDGLSAFESVGLRRAPPDAIRARGVGGTSALWSGRCGVFDAIDYQARPWVPHSGWPIDGDDVAPYLDRAGRRLGLGPALYAERHVTGFLRPDTAGPWNRDHFLPVIWQFSQHGRTAPARTFAADGIAGAEQIGALQHAGAPRPIHFGDAYLPTLAASETVHLLTGATALSVETDATGARVGAVRVGTIDGRRGRIAARFVVLACGGIDNARLLLCSRSASPDGLGNRHGLVGRYLSDHPFGPIATYTGRGSEALRRRLGHRWLERNGTRHVYALGLRLAPALQRREELLNGAIHIVERGERTAPVARMGSAVRRLRQGALGHDLAADLVGALGRPIDLAKGGYDRYVARRPALEIPDRVDFGCVVEQVPDSDSRVTLSERTDALGMPLARIDWRASDREFETARRMAELLKAEIGRLGFAPPDFAPWLDRGPDAFRALIHDMAHPMGTTRMAADPSRGVVDADCQVHGVAGLYVAGGSVFPTSGYMNPTLMIVALAIRLADHLERRIRDEAAPAIRTGTPVMRPAAAAAPHRCRVGLVGAGDRVRRIYAPILKALGDRFEVVGVTARSGEGRQRFSSEFRIDAFPDAASLAAEREPDFLLVAVAATQIESALPGLLEIGPPLLVETPLAWTPRAGRKILAGIRRFGRVVGVAEQTPFLPGEQLKRRLIELGTIGSVRTAQNAFAFYDYHGIAALRAILAGARRPVRVSATAQARPGLRGGAGQDLYATVTYDDGAVLLHHYGDASAESPLRCDRGLRAYGDAGTLADDAMHLSQASGACTRHPFVREQVAGRLQAITVETPAGPVAWRNPFGDHDFSDEQIAVATLLTDMASAVRSGGAPAYPAQAAIEDMDLLAAMRLSALRVGRPVALPLSATEHLIRARLLPKLAARSVGAAGALSSRLGRPRAVRVP